MSRLDDPPRRTCLVTGANSGIGLELAERLAERGDRVVLACRSEARTAPVLASIRARHPGLDVSFLQIDLSDLASVRRAAGEWLALGRPLDVLVNNAGIAGTRSITRDGFDLTYATNHLGPFLLTGLLLPRLRESPDARVVNVASAAHLNVKAIDWSVLDRRSTPRRSAYADYAVTKLMNVLHAKELARRLDGTSIVSCSLHPGAIATNIWRAVPQPFRWALALFLKDVKKGVETPLYCATSPEVRARSGRYFEDCREATPSALAEDAALARELWERTEALVAPAVAGSGLTSSEQSSRAPVPPAP